MSFSDPCLSRLLVAQKKALLMKCEGLVLMSLYQNHSILNSSYRWWGAWLGNNNKGINVAPWKWFNYPMWDTSHFNPQNWKRLAIWARMSKITQFANYPEMLLYFRKHSSSVSASHIAKQKEISASISQKLISITLNKPVELDIVQTARI